MTTVAAVLVNNAGVMLLGPFGSGQRGDYRQMIEVSAGLRPAIDVDR